MRTGGFDSVFEVNKVFLNKAVAELFYKGLMRIKGNFKVKSSQIPQEFTAFTNLKYKLKLNSPPRVDFTQDDKVYVFASAEAVFIVLGNIRLEFDVDFSMITDLTFDRNTNRIILDLANTKVDDFHLEDKYNLPANVIKKFNEILSTAITSNFTDQYTSKELPLVLYSQELPYMPTGDSYELDIELGGTKVLNPAVIAVCINLLKYTGGDLGAVSDFTDGVDVAAGVSEDAMHRVFNFWWDNTTFKKDYSDSNSVDIPAVDDFLNFIEPVFNMGTKLATLGFVDADYHVDRAWVDYGASISFSKPEFDLKAGNVFEISNFLVKIGLWADVKATVSVSVSVDTSGPVPDWLTPWDDDVEIEKSTTTATIVNLAMNDIEVLLKNIKGEVYLDDKNRMMGKIDSFDLEISLGDEWYDYIPNLILNGIIDFAELLIKNNLPPIVLFPAVIDKNVPTLDIPLEADIEAFDVYDDESIVTANIKIQDLPKLISPIPAFIANKDPLSLEVHMLTCSRIEEMFEEHKVGYFTLNDALGDGYDGCKYCLSEYHKR